MRILIVEDEVEIPVQVNGKVKTRILIHKGNTEEEVRKIVEEKGILDEYVQKK